MDIGLSSMVGAWPARRNSLPTKIAEALAARIRSGEMPAGERLPSEPSLARLLNVSRNTVREAISVLREQGLVSTRQGLGTFALDPHAQASWPVDVGIEHLTSTTELIRQAGHEPGSRDYLLSTVTGEAVPLQHLQLAPTDTLHCIERVRTADERPVIFCRDYISTERVPAHLMVQFRGDGSLFAFLSRECGLSILAARADILPAMPSPRVAKLMQISRRKPLLVLHQVHYEAGGAPFLYSENHFNLEYMGVHVRRTPTG